MKKARCQKTTVKQLRSTISTFVESQKALNDIQIKSSKSIAKMGILIGELAQWEAHKGTEIHPALTIRAIMRCLDDKHKEVHNLLGDNPEGCACSGCTADFGGRI